MMETFLCSVFKIEYTLLNFQLNLYLPTHITETCLLQSVSHDAHSVSDGDLDSFLKLCNQASTSSITQLNKYLLGTNMGLERLLNLFKRSAPSPQRKPRATRLVGWHFMEVSSAFFISCVSSFCNDFSMFFGSPKLGIGLRQAPLPVTHVTPMNKNMLSNS